MIPGSASPLLLASTVAQEPNLSYTGLQISRSVRFNPDDSATFTRAFAAGNQLLWTWSAWVKRAALGEHVLFGTQTSGSDIGFIGFGGDNTLFWNNKVNDTTGYGGGTIAKFTDLSAWYHIVYAYDGAQAVYTNRAKIYVNGTLSTLNADSYTPGPGLLNANLTHAIGARFLFGGTSIHTAGYMADVYFIDGQALTPSSFGQTDTDYANQWVPKTYSGSYGTNGFHLDFADNSNNTASTLGKDTSGNSNNWTPNNLSVTAGAGNDSLVDTPTSYGTDTGVGGEVRGNYATLNPLDGSPAGLSNGNLDASSANAYPTIIPGSGSWYYEVNGTGYSWNGTRSNWTPRAGSHNFGQRAFSSTAPSGFKALCDTNIPQGTITTSGTFTGNASADGPFVYLNGVPTAMTINSNAVTFATHADKLSNGFKLRTSSGSYNTAGSNSYSITTTGAKFRYARAQPNP